MDQNRALAFGLVCLLAAAGIASVSAGQDKAATSQPAAVAEPASKPAVSVAPAVAPKPTTLIAKEGPASVPAAETKPSAETKPVETAVVSPTETKPVPQSRPVAVEPAPTSAPTARTPEPAKVAPRKLDAFAHGKTIAVVPDQEIVVELKGSTATPWELTKVDGASVQQVGKVEFKPKAEGAKEGVYTATFKAGKEGKTVIQLQGLIEAGKKDKMEVKFTVTVAAAT